MSLCSFPRFVWKVPVTAAQGRAEGGLPAAG
jgi:hypothetical protein